MTLVDPFTQRPFPGNVLPASRIDPVGANLMALYPVPNHADDAANLVSSPEGRRNGIQATIKTDHHGWQDRPIQVRYTYSREDRDLPFPTRSRNLPGFGVAVLDEGHQFSASVSRTSGRMFHETRFGLNALDRDNAPQSAGVDQFAALGITPPPYDPSVDQGYLTTVVPGFETLGDDTNLPVRRQTRTLHLSETIGLDRGRHHAKIGGELRHYQSDGYNHLFSRGQAVFTGAFTGHPAADMLLGYPTITLLAANDNRQALRTWSANVFAQDDWRVSSRLTINAGRALRVQRAAGGRRRSHGRLRPGHAVGAAGGAERRAALRPRLGLQQLRAARRRQLGSHRPRHPGDARRLRPLLRQRHADRELGALFQPAVLAAAALLPERAGPDLDRRPVPDRHRLSRPRRPSTPSPAGSAPATRSRRASAWSARSPRSR